MDVTPFTSFYGIVSTNQKNSSHEKKPSLQNCFCFTNDYCIK